jgi:hypothetical protein
LPHYQCTQAFQVSKTLADGGGAMSLRKTKGNETVITFMNHENGYQQKNYIKKIKLCKSE